MEADKSLNDLYNRKKSANYVMNYGRLLFA